MSRQPCSTSQRPIEFYRPQAIFDMLAIEIWLPNCQFANLPAQGLQHRNRSCRTYSHVVIMARSTVDQSSPVSSRAAPQCFRGLAPVRFSVV